MSKIRKVALLMVIALAAGGCGTALAARSQAAKHRYAAEHRYVVEVLRLMDLDHDGLVSREEFLQFMGAEFSRIDVRGAGVITPEQLSRQLYRSSLHANRHR